MRMRIWVTGIITVMALLTAGCTPTTGTGGGGGGRPPHAPAVPNAPVVDGAILVITTTDVKTGQPIVMNERDYPLFVTINVKNHQQESAIGFPEHLLVNRNPWEHTVEWPQVDQFDHAEALLSVPLLVPGVWVTCRWKTLGGVPYANTGEIAQKGGSPAEMHRPGDQAGTVCILLASMLGQG
jgi:hypothetical protein